MNREKLTVYNKKMFQFFEKNGYTTPTHEGGPALWFVWPKDKPDDLKIIISRPTPDYPIRPRVWRVVKTLYKVTPCYYYTPENGIERITDEFEHTKWEGKKK